MIIGVMIFLLGIGGILFYDRYYVPVIMSENVVKIKVDQEIQFLPRNYTLKEDDLFIDKLPSEHLPKGYLTSIDQAVGKVLNVNLTNGTILTDTMIDLDDLTPAAGEGIFSIPSDAIFAVNGTLRRRDRVNVYLITDPRSRSRTENVEQESSATFLKNVQVAYVRAANNNDVRDTEEGNINDRITSTAQVAHIEVILTEQQGIELKKMIEQGYLLWIVRVE